MDCNNCKKFEQCFEEEWIVTSSNGKDCDSFESKTDCATD